MVPNIKSVTIHCYSSHMLCLSNPTIGGGNMGAVGAVAPIVHLSEGQCPNAGADLGLNSWGGHLVGVVSFNE